VVLWVAVAALALLLNPFPPPYQAKKLYDPWAPSITLIEQVEVPAGPSTQVPHE